MRHCLAALMLFAVLPVMNALAAPVPESFAILNIEPSPKGERAEQHRDKVIDNLTYPHGLLLWAWSDPEVRKLPSIAALKDARYWLSENLRVTWDGEGNRLRLKFRAGTRAEQVVILNALLRAYLRATGERIKFHEEALRWNENCILELEKRIESGQQRDWDDSHRKGISNLRSNSIPACRAEIARWKQAAVVKWAK
jgi:hypothetical protein